MTTLPRTNDVRATGTGRRRTTYTVMVRLAVLAILLEGVWAGLFLQHDGQRDAAGTWLATHAVCGVAAVALATLATVYALWDLRARRDLWAGGLLLTVALAAETALGFQISDAERDAATVVHVPLALGVLALGVCARRPRVATRSCRPRRGPGHGLSRVTRVTRTDPAAV